MKTVAMTLSILLALTAVCVGQQLQQPGVSVGGEVLRLNIERQEALKRLSSCCKTVPFGNDAVIVTDKKDINQVFGTIYFEDGRVSGIAADKNWSPEPASYETALAFYRLVDQIAHGGPAKVTVSTYSQEATNATSKGVIMLFSTGRRIRIEIVNLDPGQHAGQQVTVSECVGNCVDWH